MTLDRILRDKLSLVKHPRDELFGHALKAILDAGHSAPWREECRRLFAHILDRIAVEENVSPFYDQESKDLLKHHLPDFVSGMIQALEELLFQPVGLSDLTKEIEVFETSLHLLLRLMEWSVWNYEGGRCIYGKDSLQKAESIFRLPAFEIEVWGDRDEVWLSVMDLLESQYGLKKAIESTDIVYSCTTYSVIVHELPSSLIFNEAYWRTIDGIEPCMILSVQTRMVDQTILRIAFKDLNKLDKVVSKGSFEAEIFDRVVNDCGRPFDECTIQ